MAHPCDTGMCNGSNCEDCLPAPRSSNTQTPSEPVIGKELADFLEEVWSEKD